MTTHSTSEGARVARQHQLAARKAFGHETDWRPGRDGAFDLVNEHVLGDAVDGVDRVAFVVVRDVGEGGHRGAFARGDDVGANATVQREDRFEQGVGHGRLGSVG